MNTPTITPEELARHLRGRGILIDVRRTVIPPGWVPDHATVERITGERVRWYPAPLYKIPRTYENGKFDPSGLTRPLRKPASTLEK